MTGLILFLCNWWLLRGAMPLAFRCLLYITTLVAGFLCMLAAGLWISRLLNSQLMKDVFNLENESFMQERRLMTNEYSVNIPTKFWYKKKEWAG